MCSMMKIRLVAMQLLSSKACLKKHEYNIIGQNSYFIIEILPKKQLLAILKILLDFIIFERCLRFMVTSYKG